MTPEGIEFCAREHLERVCSLLAQALARQLGASAPGHGPTHRWEGGEHVFTLAHDGERQEAVIACALPTLPATEARMRALLAWNLIERLSPVVFGLDPSADQLIASIRLPLALVDGEEEPVAAMALDALADAIADAGRAGAL